MTKRTYGLALAALLMLGLLAGCGSSNDSSSNSSNTNGSTHSSNASMSESGPETVKTADASMGTILVNGEGKTLYLFERDRGPHSTCSGACLQNWPAVTTDGAPKASGDVNASMLGTSKRDDGSTQVTYGGHPLYYFAGDSSPGDTSGQGVDAFGAEWYVVGPNGSKVEGHEEASGGGKSDDARGSY
jgi:predicted lipoprotein with Yx(FWY)xxD motif